MDARLIYESSKNRLLKIEWIKTKDAESEWQFFSLENISEKQISKIVKEEYVYFVSSRTESFEIKKTELVKKVLEVFGKSDFFIWDKDFKKVIEFNKIGIYRSGINASY